MKRLFLLLLILTLALSACGKNELDSFTESFNSNVKKYEVPELDPSEFGEIEAEENMSWQQLYESRNYTLDAKYKDGKNLSGYHLAMAYEQPYEKQEGVAYNASLVIAEALDMNVATYVKEFGNALNESSYTYTDGDYRVEFVNPGASSLTSIGMIINFNKK